MSHCSEIAYNSSGFSELQQLKKTTKLLQMMLLYHNAVKCILAGVFRGIEGVVYTEQF